MFNWRPRFLKWTGTYRNMLHSLHQVFSWKKWPQAFSPCSFECLMSGVRTSTGSLQSSKVRDCSSFSRCLQVTHHSECILWCFQHLQASGAVDTSMTRSFTSQATIKPYHQDSTENMHATPDTACEPVYSMLSFMLSFIYSLSHGSWNGSRNMSKKHCAWCPRTFQATFQAFHATPELQTIVNLVNQMDMTDSKWKKYHRNPMTVSQCP